MIDRPSTIRISEPQKIGLRPAYLIPAVAFIALAIVLGWGLTRNPSEIPSALIGKPVPAFALPPVRGRSLGLSGLSLRGEVSLVNVFASWCVPCRAEHPLLMRLNARNAVPIHGLNYKDKPEEASAWLDELGDPYTRTGADLDGRIAIEWGVYGVPETFVISKDGTIAYRHIGPITREVVQKTILPMVERLRRQ